MSHAPALEAPTTSLPRLRSANPDDVTEAKIAAALRNLTAIYCPLPRAAAFGQPSLPSRRAKYLLPLPITSGTSTPIPVDSGYASGDEDDDESTTAPTDQDHATALRADEYERQFATRWLTSFLARADELLPTPTTDDDDALRQRFIDEASSILASFSSATDADADDDGGAIVRDFHFSAAGGDIHVRLTDGTPATGSDHTDVGLQSWGASIVVSDLMCASPTSFGLTPQSLGPTPRIVELGAGTGLVGITLAKLLPLIGVRAAHIVATDYHPAVLGNLRDNIAANFPCSDDDDGGSGATPLPVDTCLLDWAAPCLEAPLLGEGAADVLVATDVVYAPEHAVWLRDCAARMLAPRGVFWLVASVRPNGRFEGVTDTVEAAFNKDGGAACPRGQDGRVVLRILEKNMVDKRKGIGRGDEIGYKVFKVGWSEV